MRKKSFIVIITFLLVLNSSGCTTLRKKFIREKDGKKETESVYLAFKEYGGKPSRQVYVDYYLYIRGWLDELLQQLQESGNLKRGKYALNEAVVNLEQLISFLNEEGKQKINSLYEILLSVRPELTNTSCLNEVKRKTIIDKVEYFMRKFDADFNYTDAQVLLKEDSFQ